MLTRNTSTKLSALPSTGYSNDMFMSRRGWNNGAGMVNRLSGMSQYMATITYPTVNTVQKNTFVNFEEVAKTLYDLHDEDEPVPIPESVIKLAADAPMVDGNLNNTPPVTL
jgi:hypothetical protein